jgi:hypothetical protein
MNGRSIPFLELSLAAIPPKTAKNHTIPVKVFALKDVAANAGGIADFPIDQLCLIRVNLWPKTACGDKRPELVLAKVTYLTLTHAVSSIQADLVSRCGSWAWSTRKRGCQTLHIRVPPKRQESSLSS